MRRILLFACILLALENAFAQNKKIDNLYEKKERYQTKATKTADRILNKIRRQGYDYTLPNTSETETFPLLADPSPSSLVLRQIPTKSDIRIYDVQYEYFRVGYRGYRGYLRADYLNIPPENPLYLVVQRMYDDPDIASHLAQSASPAEVYDYRFLAKVHPDLPSFSIELAGESIAGGKSVWLHEVNIENPVTDKPKTFATKNLIALVCFDCEYLAVSPLEDDKPVYKLVDINFDGYKDLQVLWNKAVHQRSYFYWLFNPETKTFEFADQVTRTILDNPQVDTLHQELSSKVKSGCCSKTFLTYQYRGKELKIVQKVTDEYIGSEYLERYIKTEQLIDDEMVIVRYEEEKDGLRVIKERRGGELDIVRREPIRKRQ